jgi:hypothetical protein
MPKLLPSPTFRLFNIVMSQKDQLASAERRRELGFDALVDEVVRESLSLAQYSFEGAYPWWEGLVELLTFFNGHLAGVGAPPIEAPSYDRFMELLAQYEADDWASMTEESRKAIKKWARHAGWDENVASEVRARAVPMVKTLSAVLGNLPSSSASPVDADDQH